MGLLDWSSDNADVVVLPNYDFGLGSSSSHRSASSSDQGTEDSSSTRSSNSNGKLDKVTSTTSSQASSDYSSASSPRGPVAKLRSSQFPSINLPPPSSTLNDDACTRKRSCSAPTKTKTRSRRSSTTTRPRPPARRTFSFDLYHEDEELQEAEPRITFCDICRKPCEIH